MTIEEYEIKSQKIREENNKYLNMFQVDLQEKGVSDRTVCSHLSNVDFYINDFLIYGKPLSIKEGCACVDEYLGDFFIRKCMWSTPPTIKSSAASLKRFYKCMMDHNEIDKEDYKKLCVTIKENLEDWMKNCRIFNDPEQTSPFYY